MRKILIIHESRTLRILLKRYIASDLSEFEVCEAASGEEGIQMLQHEKVEAIISGNKMQSMDGPAIKRIVHELPAHHETPFIVVTSSKKEDELVELLKEGIEHFLISPFTSKELGTKINAVCDPRKWRAQERISVPGTKAILHFGEKSVPAQVVNISQGGILFDLDYSEEHGNLLKNIFISVLFPAEYASVELLSLRCKFHRLNMLTCDKEHNPEKIRIGLQFVDVSEINLKAIAAIFEQARGELEKLAVD